MKVIFLDIDGVLNSLTYFEENNILDGIDKEKVKLLQDIIRKTQVEIVLSSSWRIGYNKDDTSHPCYKLKEYGLNIMDFTPVLRTNRGSEIKAWLNKNKVDKFIILDDESDMGDLLPYLVKTDWKNGLTKIEAEECIKRLS